MRKIRWFSPNLLFLLLIFLMMPKKVDAYIDPGTGSYVFQIIMAAILGSLVAIRMFWKKIIYFFRKVFSKKSKNDQMETK